MSDPLQKREGLCQLCKQEYPVWIAPNNLWNRVMRHADGTDVYDFVCPTCFAKEAEAMGIIPTAWCLTEEQPTHPVDPKDTVSSKPSQDFSAHLPKPVDEELREALHAELLQYKAELANGLNQLASGKTATELSTDRLEQLFAAHLQAAEKAYGGCHNCYGKGYATANEFASGRSAKWRISNMRFCNCERGKQLEEKLNERVQAAVRAAKQEVINDIFEMSPKGSFQNWKPTDAFRFYERLKSYEQQLNQGEK